MPEENYHESIGKIVVISKTVGDYNKQAFHTSYFDGYLAFEEK